MKKTRISNRTDKNTKAMITTLLFFVALCFSAMANAGGDLVNNGGGLAEKNFYYAHEKLKQNIQLCLGSDFCKLESNQRVILTKILIGLPNESISSLQFASERKQPGFFKIDGEIKVAKTGSLVNSPIYINLDMIYTKNEMGFYIPLSVPDATAILIHELGHHYGSFSHSDLDVLGVKVASMMNKKTHNTPLLPWSSQIALTVFNPDVDQTFPDILLYAEDTVVDLTKEYKKIAFCPVFTVPVPILPLPDIQVSTEKPLGSVIHNLHWTKFNTSGKSAKLKLVGNISHKCKDKEKNILFRSQDFSVEIEFSLNQDNTGKWILDLARMEIAQTKNPWWKIIRF